MRRLGLGLMVAGLLLALAACAPGANPLTPVIDGLTGTTKAERCEAAETLARQKLAAVNDGVPLLDYQWTAWDAEWTYLLRECPHPDDIWLLAPIRPEPAS